MMEEIETPFVASLNIKVYGKDCEQLDSEERTIIFGIMGG